MEKKRVEKTAIRMGDGLYSYRGYQIKRVGMREWEIRNSWGQLVAAASSLTFAKYSVDDKITFEEQLKGGKRYG